MDVRVVRALLALLALLMAAAPAAAADGPTVSRTVDAAVAAGRLGPDEAAGYKATYTLARRTASRLPAARERELRGAMAVLEGLVKRRQLPPERMPAAFLQLGRNVEWWRANGAPRSSAATGGLPRVTFPGDPIVLQWYPGQGLAIQWLATFGKANALWSLGRAGELRLLLDRAVALAGRRGYLAWEYLFRFGSGRAPWVSGMAQGTGIQAFTRGAQLLGNPAYLEVARQALGAFEAPPPRGVSVRSGEGRGRHYLLYSYAPRMRVLNGFLQALVGVRDLAQATGDPRAQAIYAAGDTAARRELRRADTGAWSLYSLGGAESSLSYHQLVTGFLGSLCTRTSEPAYCDARARFARYTREPPVVRISFTGRRRAKRTLTIHVRVSKISSVTLAVRRGGDVVLARSATLRRGTHRFRLEPSRRGGLRVDVTARDLAGNVGSDARAVAIRGGS